MKTNKAKVFQVITQCLRSLRLTFSARVESWRKPSNWPAQALYEQLYCARGEMENRIEEQFS